MNLKGHEFVCLFVFKAYFFVEVKTVSLHSVCKPAWSLGLATLQVKINSKDSSQTHFRSQLRIVLAVLNQVKINFSKLPHPHL